MVSFPSCFALRRPCRVLRPIAVAGTQTRHTSLFEAAVGPLLEAPRFVRRLQRSAVGGTPRGPKIEPRSSARA
eukprot:8455802-Alexandrium_andersonii.AAC.1